MSRYGIDTTAPASFLLQGFQTGANTAETRLRREQQQAQFDVNQQNYQNELAAQAARQAEIKQQRQYTAEALHAAVMEQLGRTQGARPTYLDAAAPMLGDVSGIGMPDVLNEPMQDDSDTQWQKAADAAKAKGNIEGLEVLLKEGGTREKRVRNSQLVRHFKDVYGGNQNLLADDNMRMLFSTLESADDPADLVQRIYSQQQAERVYQQRQAADEKALAAAYEALNNKGSSPQVRAQAQAVVSTRGKRSAVDDLPPDQVLAAINQIEDPEERARMLAVFQSTGRMTPTLMDKAMGGGGKQPQVVTRVIMGKDGKSTRVYASNPPGHSLPWIDGNDIVEQFRQKVSPNVNAGGEDAGRPGTAMSRLAPSWLWGTTDKEMADYKAKIDEAAKDMARQMGFKVADGTENPDPVSMPGEGVPGGDEPDADTLEDQLIDAGMSAEEIAAELRRRGLEQ